MSYEYNDKGKVFTEVIHKDAIAVTIQTTTNRIEGNIHIRKGGRMKDELDRDEAFLAVTDAKVFSNSGVVVAQGDFISVSRSQIVWIIPGDDPEQ